MDSLGSVVGYSESCTEPSDSVKDVSDYIFVNTYLFMELSSSRRAANCEAPQELPSILWNPKVQYRINKSPPLVPILSHIKPIHFILS
jgi:hypothetical protein